MSSTETGSSNDVRQEVQDLRKELEVHMAAQAGANATQAATADSLDPR